MRVDKAYKRRRLVKFELSKQGHAFDPKDLSQNEHGGNEIREDATDVEGRVNPFKGVWLNYKQRKCDVTVDDSHMYIYLLRLAFFKEFNHNYSYERMGYVPFAAMKQFENQGIKKMFDDLGHEHKHMAVIQGSKSRKLLYGVQFWEDESSGLVYYLPFVAVRGKMRYWEFVQMIQGPGEDMSLTDKTILGKKLQ